MANNAKKSPYVDPGWPSVADGEHAVTELSSARAGGLSPFGEDTEFPLPVDRLPYMHPRTVINR
jgi:prolyl-tRNA editing enzyme YbaK/EbsC (Cys-tRNA(Pro) deacylase)